MTHDELLEALNNELKRAQWEGQCHNSGWEEGVLALIAVVELHKPIEQTTGMSYTQENGLQVLATEFICAFCKDTGVIEYRYPCFTIKAIEKALI